MDVKQENPEYLIEHVTIKTENTNEVEVPIKTELDTSVIKCENYLLENITTKIKEERVDDEIKSELVTFECDIPDFKNEFEGFTSGPSTSKISRKVLCKTKKGLKKRTNKKKKRYSCPVCQKGVARFFRRKVHFNSHFKKSFVICLFCGKIFIEPKMYMLHFISHYLKMRKIVKANREVVLQSSNPIHSTANTFRQYECKICSERYDSLNDFNAHMPRHTDFTQGQCLKIVMFSRIEEKNREILPSSSKQSSFTRSKTLDVTEERFKCKICSRTFEQKHHLYDHIFSQYIKGKSFRCDLCFEYFRSNAELNIHIGNHRKEKTFKCDVCSKVFDKRGVFNYHMRFHADEKPFKCELCSKYFRASSDLIIHKNNHHQDKIFKCHICPKSFNYRNDLKSHMYRHTGVKETYKCNMCSKIFTHTGSFNYHMMFHIKI